ncbi:hypothetical protein B0J13DRAFT_594346 [Dactylonectria estremocensis]|uniref:AMP-dependent synthetase/ligase domain-containing protein n=1 Tax=Dactylonectria estremocensis TaxID=1079267 RepID=A0A9P9JCY6_9HYPO|nr:hypothetical protein B0J13DRAFT_594346 [Dactylonectria estremocensis]
MARHICGLLSSCAVLRVYKPVSSVSPFPTVTAAFYHHARSHPENMAICDLSGPRREMTYGDLALRVQALARRLHRQGVTPGQRVPLIVKRGLEMIVGILAILSCGAQYIPLDGGVVPDETIRQVLDQTQGDVVLCLSSTKHRTTALCPEHTTVVVDEPEPPNPGAVLECGHAFDLAAPDGGCYVIYTSGFCSYSSCLGTTGQPKGVDITHRNVVNLVCLSPGNLGVTAGLRVGSLLNISFDMAAWEIFSCLCNEGTLVIRGSEWELTLQEIDVLICTPTILAKHRPAQYPMIKTVATAGEPMTQNLADLWASHGTYWNCCGPTEATIVNTMQKHIVGDELSIGRPTPNNKIYILGEDGEAAPPGSSGVMWAGGLGVSRGYVGLEGKTAEKFMPDRFANDGSNMYNTGDLGRWRLDGSIEILGRVDDQVKVKGFRVELDGVSASLSSAPGVSQAVVLLILGKIHGFVSPWHCDVATIVKHMQERQPYYAVPTYVHVLGDLPATANGKIDKKTLQAAVLAKASAEKSQLLVKESEKGPCIRQLEVELKSQGSMSTLSDIKERQDLSEGAPGKLWPQPFRGLRYRMFIVYRTLFTLVGIANLTVLICALALSLNSDLLGTMGAINLAAAVLVRQDTVINVLYKVTCSVPKRFPLWIRARCAKIYHLGGVHSAAGICATAWLVLSTVRGAICDGGFCSGPKTGSLAIQVVSWFLCGLCCVMVGSAWPSFRKRHHNLFERSHRFAGWTALGLLWVRTVLVIDRAYRTRSGQSFGTVAVHSADFWFLVLATSSIVSSWLLLRKVPVHAEVLSDHAVRLYFDYTTPVNGTFTRISRRPLLEWHSFATIPSSEATENTRGYSLLVSNAGDWTRDCIRNPPNKLWVRGVPTCGVMRIATLFNRIVVIATGSGIGPLLGHISKPTCPTQLIWSTARPEETFGPGIVGLIKDKIPDAMIHDTKLHGRPDLVQMGFNLAQNFGAEAVVIIANEKLTKKIVYGLETRGMRAMLSLRRTGATASSAIRKGLWSQSAVGRLYSQSVRPLAYDLHEPTSPRTDKQKAPILFLHGLFGSKKNNRGISKALARDLGRYVYALDLRNHGESPHDTRHDYVAMAQDVADFIQDHGLTETTLIGHSMGAKTSMTLALRSPELVSDIVAVDNAPVDVTLSRDFAEYIRSMKKIQDANITRQAEADAILSEYEKSLPIRQFLLGNLHRPAGEKTQKFRIPLDIIGRSLDNLGDFPYKDPNEIRFEKPALFVRGTKSKYVPDELLPLIGQFFPRFRMVDVDAGHWLISEQPEAFRRGSCSLPSVFSGTNHKLLTMDANVRGSCG